jgi:hypothetical protein
MKLPSMSHSPLAARCRQLAQALHRNEAGVSVVEFAFSLPFLVGLGMYGVEIAYMTSVNMQISQLAISVADNASRLGQTENSAVAPTIAETDVDAVMFGAMTQGAQLGFEQNGRVIVSSLERHENGRQYIHWQRCGGELDKDSRYGNDTDRNGLTGIPLPGLGEPGRIVTALDKQAVMFVEVFYTYQPLFGTMFVNEKSFGHEAAFIVRDDRNLSGLSGTPFSTC